MKANEVIEAYVLDVMRRLPRKDRNGIGFELRELLNEMLDERAAQSGRELDDATVLNALREFGTPAEVAARYRSTDTVIIPSEQTRSFVWIALIGVALQWALSLPRVFEGQSLTAWWFSGGLGALWWPGFMVMMSMAALGLRQLGWFKPTWTPRRVDPERINRTAMLFGLAGFVIGAALMISLPWLAPRLADPMPAIFAFDVEFLHLRSWPVLLLWAISFVLLVRVTIDGRWSPLQRRIEMAGNLGFVALFAWWLSAGPIFQAKATNDAARACIALIALMIVLDLLIKLYRHRVRIHAPKMAG